MRFWNEISDRLAGLTGSATPEQTRAALNEFDVRDIQAVRVSENTGGVGGNVPFVGVDPPPDPTDGMLWWDPDDNTPGGGSQPVYVRLPISFDTPGLVLTGIPFHTVTAGDFVPAPGGADNSCFFVTEPWDGTTPVLHVRPAGGSNYGVPLDLTESPTTDGNGGTYPNTGDPGLFGGWGAFLPPAGDLEVMVDDGSAGDPVSTQGAGELVFVYIPAAP